MWLTVVGSSMSAADEREGSLEAAAAVPSAAGHADKAEKAVKGGAVEGLGCWLVQCKGRAVLKVCFS